MSIAHLNVAAVAQIREKVRGVLYNGKDVDRRAFGCCSTGEKLAVALVLDRYDLLEGYGMLDAVDRLMPDWCPAALYVKRNGWADDEREAG
jgi:hypothetical protein